MAFDRWGRYLIVPRDGGDPVPHTRATTLAGTLDDSYGLRKWEQRMVAIGLSRRADLLAGVAAARDDDKTRLDSLVVDAVEAAEASKGRNIGQAEHEFTERLDLGEIELSQVPEAWRADIEAYAKVMRTEAFEIELVEQTVVIPELVIAGTLDRTVLRAGERYVLDVKTGRTLWLPSIAIQLALYAHADSLYDLNTDTHRDMVPINQQVGYVVHVPAGGGTAKVVGIDLEKGWRGALLAAQVRAWRNEEFGVVNRRDWLTAQVRRLVDEYPEAAADLAKRWPIGVPTLKTNGHTPDQIDAITVVLHDVEGEHQLPFSDSADPKPKKKTTERKTA